MSHYADMRSEVPAIEDLMQRMVRCADVAGVERVREVGPGRFGFLVRRAFLTLAPYVVGECDFCLGQRRLVGLADTLEEAERAWSKAFETVNNGGAR